MSDTLTRGDGKLSQNNISDEIYALLRDRILNHTYPAGFRFDLNALETQLGISRTPIKVALHRLEGQGLIEIRPRRGTFVANVTTRDIVEAFDVRRVLEIYAAELAARQATPAEIEQLHIVAKQMSRLLTSDDYQAIVDRYIRLDHEFHDRLVGLAHNNKLIDIYRQIDIHLQIARIRLKFARADSMQTESEHDGILHALEAKDAQALVKAVADHIDLSKARILKVLDQDA